MDNTPLSCKVAIAHSGQETRDSKPQKSMQHPRAKKDVSFSTRIAAWVFRGGVLSHMARVNFSQAMPCSHVNTTPQSRQFSGRHDSSPLGFLLILASSGYGHSFVSFIRGCFVR
ncbi:uncharacterized protein N7487_001176 [Penicillium crustosum]|uniref:uncharacterized protein n=1 Tax=Penicillium crustosum TaxID=36656 RepID=UPI0023A6F2E1|nr:uncharacterized protein N7487_001176 [Penicillium crustosum]KAJ5417626.1 hypothetical protein N7487_001176 [Penicillium crustosum]